MKVAIEPFIYFHTVCDGYYARRRFPSPRSRKGYREKSKYFSVGKFGSLEAAYRRARWWKQRNLLN